MANINSQIRPAVGATGPYFTVTEVDGITKYVATGLTLAAAFNKARDDQATEVAGLTVQKVVISTNAA